MICQQERDSSFRPLYSQWQIQWPFTSLHLYCHFSAQPRAQFGPSHYAIMGKAGASTLTLGDF